MIKKILKKLFRKKIIRNFKKYLSLEKGRALVYYKTDYFLLNGILEDRSHTNEWESYEIARVLNSLGFIVDVIDRTATLEDIEKITDIYDIFVGIGAGDSGKYFKDIAIKIPSAIRIIYALGPEPDLSNIITKKRHDEFLERFPGNEIVYRRMIHDVDISESMKYTEAIITCCNDWGIEGYKKFGKQIERVWLSSYEGLRTTPEEISKKDQKKFLYFGGNGNIMKGLPLVIEAFSKLPDLELYIGAPTTEEDFNAIMKPMLDASPNIHFVGFMDVKGEEYGGISRDCGYVILPSSSEGCATSVTTCMRRGLIPIVTVETGVDVGDFGYMLESMDMDYIVAKLRSISEEDRSEFERRAQATYKESEKYTQENFTRTFTEAVKNIITKNK